MSLLNYLGFGKETGTTGDTAAVRKIIEALDRMDRPRARYLAAFAYILSRAARADLEVTETETREMERLVMEHGGLPEAQAILVVQIAKTQNLLFGGTEDFLVTREFEQIATPEEKLALLHCLFAVSSSDAGIATVEDNEIRRIAVELKIDHADFILVRARFRAHLKVLRDPAP